MATPPLVFPVSVRQRVLKAIQRAYVERGAQLQAELGWTWRGVELGGLGNFDFAKRAMIGIVAGREEKDPQYPLYNVRLPFAVEFHFTRNKGEDKPGEIAEGVLTIVQNVLHANKRLVFPPDGPIVIDINETGNEVDIDTYGDKSVAGVVEWVVIYRHSEHDVTDPNPGF